MAGGRGPGYGWVTCDQAGGKVLLELFIVDMVRGLAQAVGALVEGYDRQNQ